MQSPLALSPGRLSRLMPAISRNAAIALSVVLLHLGFVYVLYSGLLVRAVELVLPVAVLSQFIEPPKPQETPPSPPPPPQAQVKKPTNPTPTKVPTVVAPVPLAISDPTPALNAPTGSTAPQPAPAPIAAPVAAVTVAPPTAAALVVQLPSSDADYLQNPKPGYPAISRRMNEQGKTTVRVLIGADGQPQRAEIVKSSGFSRLDDAALATVLRWRFVPGKRGGVPETMWFNVPINWVLE